MTNWRKPVSYAVIEYGDDGIPYSPQFNDVYFSKHSGLEETRHVFIEGNDLIARWQVLPPEQPGCFIIAETGFGTGLNFLSAWELWERYAPASWQLHFLSCELFPLSPEDLRRCCALWPQLSVYSKALLANYPACIPGIHRLDLGNRVTLNLMLGDANSMLQELLPTKAPGLTQKTRLFGVDAWFLDGFNPKHNDSLWQAELFDAMKLLSKSDTTVATYTVAAKVKRGLTEAGFCLEKRAGFGRKREMLVARFAPKEERTPSFKSSAPYQTPWHVSPNGLKRKQCRQAIVVGAGIVGCHLAHALAKKGWQLTVLEQHQRIAAAASGNHQGALFAKLSPYHSPLTDFVLSSYLYARQFYRNYLEGVSFADLSGLLQLAYNAKELASLEQLHQWVSHYPQIARIVSAKQASKLVGIELSHPGLFWPDSGWLDPVQLCHSLIEHPQIQLMTEAKVGQVEHVNGEWVCQTSHADFRAPVLIFANGTGCSSIECLAHLPVKPIKGQVTYWPGDEQSHLLRLALCADGYILPHYQGFHSLGATYNLGKTEHDSAGLNNEKNLSRLVHFDLDDGSCANGVQPGYRQSYRLATPDYLPIVGGAPLPGLMAQRFDSFSKNANVFISEPGCYYPDLYVSVGFGSRALTYAPLCAAHLASLINREPSPLSNRMIKHLSPARFIIRNIARKKSL